MKKNFEKKIWKKKFEKKNLKKNLKKKIWKKKFEIFFFFFRQIRFYWLSVGFQNRKCSLFHFRFYQNVHTKVVDWLTELESHSESAKIQKSSSNRRKIAISRDFWQYLAKKEDFTSFLKFLIIPDMLCISVSVFPNIYIWGKNWKKKFEKKKFEKKKNLKFFEKKVFFYH